MTREASRLRLSGHFWASRLSHAESRPGGPWRIGQRIQAVYLEMGAGRRSPMVGLRGKGFESPEDSLVNFFLLPAGPS